MIEQWTKELVVQRLLAFILLAVLIILCLQVVKFFISPAIWAAILAYVTFPLYQFFHQKVHLSPTLSALIMTAVISLIIGVPLVIGVFFLQQEIIEFYSMAVRRLQAGYIDLPENIKNLPMVGEYIKNTLWQINKNPEDSMAAIRQWIQSHLYYGKLAFDVALKNLAKLGMALMTVFFFYRDGLSLVKQIRQAMRNIIGDRIDHHIDSIASTTQAVVYGIGLTALAQALLAGVGYAFAGAPNPILLTLITFVVALIPIGVLGGLTAFGFVGLFIGPVVLAIGLAVWREWISQHKNEIFAPKDSIVPVSDGKALLADTHGKKTPKSTHN